jgi:polysaccharide biosynthesis/export protein ExoF
VGRGFGRAVFQLGDKLKIAFYEQVDLQDDRWAKARSNRPGLQQRTELTGEYVVQADGAISLPLFGLVQTAGRSSQELQTDLEGMFRELTGRKGFVTAAVLEHQPIYVLGPVKTPGSYKYASGMTVFHAVALAGGLDRTTLGTWQDVEGVRAAEKQQASIDHLIRLLARTAVMKAERDGTPLKASIRLIELAGELRAKNALNLEIDRREVTVTSNRARDSTLAVSIENAKQEIETLSARVPVVDANVKLRDDRVNRMRVLANRNVVDNVVVDQAQGELLSVQDRRQEMIGAISLAKQRLSLAEQERIRHQTEVRSELELVIERVEQEAADVERDLASSEGVLKAINVGGMRGADAATEDTITYEVVRHTPAGTIVLNATGTTDVEPGDLVRLRVPHETEQRAPNTVRAGRVTAGD